MAQDDKLIDRAVAHEADFATKKKDSYGTTYTLEAKTLTSAPYSVDVVKATPEGMSGYFYDEVVEKSLIMLHYTAGRLKGDIGALSQNNNKVSTAFVLARNGTLYELFDDDKWSYHLGATAVGGNTHNSKRAVAIEISNFGYLHYDPVTKRLNTDSGKYYCDEADTDAYVRLEEPFRGESYFATYTDEQYAKLKELMLYLTTKYSIPYIFLDHEERHEAFSNPARASAYKGIASHINYRTSGKWDIGPAFCWDRIADYRLPVDLGKGDAITKASVAGYYKHTEVDNKGGYYPVGINTVWHGGLHIRCAKGTRVLACADGEVVAARLPQDEDKAVRHYGSRNFILMRHSFHRKKDQYYYSLYMHLNNEPLVRTNPLFGDLRWIRNGDDSINADLIDRLRSGDPIGVPEPRIMIAAGEPLWTSGEYGGESYRAGMIHWEIFSDRYPADRDGRSVQASLMEPPRWKDIYDGTEDYNVDSIEIMKLIEQDYFGSDEILTLSELANFYSGDPAAKLVRRYACHFVTEWGINLDKAIPELKGLWKLELLNVLKDTAVMTSEDYLSPSPPKSDEKARLKERIAPYLWWGQARVLAGVGLPPSTKVFHYNPVAFLDELNFPRTGAT